MAMCVKTVCENLMKNIKLLWLLSAVVLLGACSGIHVTTDYKESEDFSAWKTWSWYEIKTPEGDAVRNTLLEDRIKSAIESELKARGYKQLESGGDFQATYQLSSESKIESRDTSVGVSYGTYRRGYGTTVSYGSPVDIREYQEGTLMIDFVSPDGQELLWRGVVKKRLSGAEQTPEERNQAVREVVAAIIAKFPPGYDAKAAQEAEQK